MPDLQRLKRSLVYRLRRLVGYQAYETLIHAVKNEVVAQVSAVQGQLQVAEVGQQSIQDQQAMTGTRVEQLVAELQFVRTQVGEVHSDVLTKLAQIEPKVPLKTVEEVGLADIDQDTADFLNYAASHRGPLAEVGLWRNDPVVVAWSAGGATVGAVNERIVEQPFVHGALGSLPTGSRILDIGGGESLVALGLASLGHHVTVLEPAGYPYRHPNLTVVEKRLEDFVPDAPFDAVILLSAIEHFGIAAYTNNGVADPDADLDAMARVRDVMLGPGAVLVLTTPFGPFAVDELERTYDQDRLARLLEGFAIDRTLVATRNDPVTWSLRAESTETPPSPGHVVMVQARRP